MLLCVLCADHCNNLILAQASSINTEVGDEAKRLLALIARVVPDHVELVLDPGLFQRIAPVVQVEQRAVERVGAILRRGRNDAQHVPTRVELRRLQRPLRPLVVVVDRHQGPHSVRFLTAVEVELGHAVLLRLPRCGLQQHFVALPLRAQWPVKPAGHGKVLGVGRRVVQPLVRTPRGCLEGVQGRRRCQDPRHCVGLQAVGMERHR
mmetsp:Transcript_79810/g.225696  ORF Transcript_79810/g.225696 Transcript_79810/m.225696 type:complete len:207 (+) Transcript_79810:272-892(+)